MIERISNASVSNQIRAGCAGGNPRENLHERESRADQNFFIFNFSGDDEFLLFSSEVISIEHQKLFALYHFSLPAFPPYGWLNIRKSNLPIASRTRERKWSFAWSAFSFFMFAVYILFMPTRLTTLLIRAIHIHSPQWNDSPMDFTSRRKQQCERGGHSK